VGPSEKGRGESQKALFFAVVRGEREGMNSTISRIWGGEKERDVSLPRMDREKGKKHSNPQETGIVLVLILFWGGKKGRLRDTMNSGEGRGQYPTSSLRRPVCRGRRGEKRLSVPWFLRYQWFRGKAVRERRKKKKKTAWISFRSCPEGKGGGSRGDLLFSREKRGGKAQWRYPRAARLREKKRGTRIKYELAVRLGERRKKKKKTRIHPLVSAPFSGGCSKEKGGSGKFTCLRCFLEGERRPSRYRFVVSHGL